MIFNITENGREKTRMHISGSDIGSDSGSSTKNDIENHLLCALRWSNTCSIMDGSTEKNICETKLLSPPLQKVRTQRTFQPNEESLLWLIR